MLTGTYNLKIKDVPVFESVQEHDSFKEIIYDECLSTTLAANVSLYTKDFKTHISSFRNWIAVTI